MRLRGDLRPQQDIPAELLAELHLLEAALGGQSLLDFIPRVSPVMPGGGRGLPPQHLKMIADQLVLSEYRPQRVCISVPPRHGKTELLIHAIAWWLSRHPEHTIAYTSYSSDLAAGKSVRARDLAQLADVRMRSDQAKASEWRTRAGGGLLAVGVGGPLTGQGANLLIVDDPLKNREEAESTTIRSKLWEWFTSTALTRVTPGGSVIVVHTRWHQDDLIGRLRKRKDWTIINLPAINEVSGKALWGAGGWDEMVLKKRREEVGEYDWWSLFMGEPRPRGGRMFESPAHYDKPNVLGAAKVLMACDPAATAKTHADYSVIVVGSCYLGLDGNPHIDILDVQRMQVEIPTLVRMLAYEQRKWRCPVIVEAAGGFKAVPQALRQIAKGVKVVEVTPTQDKFTRALPASAAWNAGRIRLPHPEGPCAKPWYDAFAQELGDFTGIGDAQDDQVDALAHLYQAACTMLQPRSHLQTGEISRYLPFG